MESTEMVSSLGSSDNKVAQQEPVTMTTRRTKMKKRRTRSKKEDPQDKVLKALTVDTAKHLERRWSDEEIADTLLRCGGNLTKACIALGYSRSHLARVVRGNDYLKEIRDDAKYNRRESVLDQVEENVEVLAMEGDWKAMRFYLETQGKNRGFVSRREQSGAEGGPIEVVIRRNKDTRI